MKFLVSRDSPLFQRLKNTTPKPLLFTAAARHPPYQRESVHKKETLTGGGGGGEDEERRTILVPFARLFVDGKLKDLCAARIYYVLLLKKKMKKLLASNVSVGRTTLLSFSLLPNTKPPQIPLSSVSKQKNTCILQRRAVYKKHSKVFFSLDIFKPSSRLSSPLLHPLLTKHATASIFPPISSRKRTCTTHTHFKERETYLQGVQGKQRIPLQKRQQQ